MKPFSQAMLKNKSILSVAILLAAVALYSCGVYKLNDVGTIPADVKTVNVRFVENRAPYQNPQLSPALTERLKLKIISQTRLTNVSGDSGHFDISAVIRDYSVTTTGVTNTGGRQQSSINRLNVTVHIVWVNTLTHQTQEFDATRNFDFPAATSLQEAERQLLNEMVRNLTDEIFNRIFSNW
jgi:hypothetical protein